MYLKLGGGNGLKYRVLLENHVRQKKIVMSLFKRMFVGEWQLFDDYKYGIILMYSLNIFQNLFIYSLKC